MVILWTDDSNWRHHWAKLPLRDTQKYRNPKKEKLKQAISFFVISLEGLSVIRYDASNHRAIVDFYPHRPISSLIWLYLQTEIQHYYSNSSNVKLRSTKDKDYRHYSNSSNVKLSSAKDKAFYIYNKGYLFYLSSMDDKDYCTSPPHFAGSNWKTSNARFWHSLSAMSMYLKVYKPNFSQYIHAWKLWQQQMRIPNYYTTAKNYGKKTIQYNYSGFTYSFPP